MQDSFSVTEMLCNVQPGDERSMAALLPLVYAELKLLAARQLGRELRAGKTPTLQPTALVHEAFLKMVGNDKGWSGRDHFMAVAATAMRQVLVDYARRKNADKRGGGEGATARYARNRNAHADVTLDGLGSDEPTTREVQVIELDDLLAELAKASERAARVAEMRLFGGMDQDQIARVLGISRMTIHRDWQIARAWLAGQLQDSAHVQ
ncbi:MAG: sigma-70 family RNA polymerase sigma factor [Pyrinomonadaceae bacterium]|nr:sigma-70 family RNA polymerase sigma factor [Phycisphaerales bacterium]